MATLAQNLKTLSSIESRLLSPPEDKGYECPFCGAAVEEDNDGWKCTSEDCDWSSYPDCEEDYTND